jgi:hypothetical protein
MKDEEFVFRDCRKVGLSVSFLVIDAFSLLFYTSCQVKHLYACLQYCSSVATCRQR